MIDTVTGLIWVHYGYVQIGQRDRFGQPISDPGAGDGVVIPGDGFAHVVLGRHTGQIALILTVHDRPPITLHDYGRVGIAEVKFSQEEIGVESFGAMHEIFSIELLSSPGTHLVRATTSPVSAHAEGEHLVAIDIWPQRLG